MFILRREVKGRKEVQIGALAKMQPNWVEYEESLFKTCSFQEVKGRNEVQIGVLGEMQPNWVKYEESLLKEC